MSTPLIPAPAEPLSYQRLMEVISDLPPSSQDYVMAFLASSDLKVRNRVAAADRKFQEAERALIRASRETKDEKKQLSELKETLEEIKHQREALKREKNRLLLVSQSGDNVAYNLNIIATKLIQFRNFLWGKRCSFLSDGDLALLRKLAHDIRKEIFPHPQEELDRGEEEESAAGADGVRAAGTGEDDAL